MIHKYYHGVANPVLDLIGAGYILLTVLITWVGVLFLEPLAYMWGKELPLGLGMHILCMMLALSAGLFLIDRLRLFSCMRNAFVNIMAQIRISRDIVEVIGPFIRIKAYVSFTLVQKTSSGYRLTIDKYVAIIKRSRCSADMLMVLDRIVEGLGTIN